MNAIVWLLVQLAFWVWLLFTVAHEMAWILLAGLAAVKLAPIVKRKKAARHEAERQREQLLIRHADEEHRLVQKGDINGVYGVYPPPASIRGMGIWLTKGRSA